ncbi:MAG TPA: GMC family oxidoreductase [Blastocatellia bacterium]|jgi:choline dehydrogenase-like flavoprotein|nr:GMC family oxidoreductase [Blastocatellia bacterium]
MAMQNIYDAVIVGSGATGGYAAKELAEKGMRVIVLEAGRKLDPNKDFREHTWPYEVPYRGTVNQQILFRERQRVQSRCYACNEYGHHFFVDDVDNPYTTPEGRPFDWIRGRQVGGRTITWGRQSYRLSDYEFKAASRDGYGEDWPFSYADLAPYYDRVERFVGISGAYENLPQLPDGRFLPAMKMTCGEHLLKKAVEGKWKDRRVTIGRSAILTQALGGRAKCHFCGHCDRGCTTASYFSSPGSTLPAAAKTGRMTLRTNAVASHIIVDPKTGKAKGVAFVDQITKATHEALGKVIVLCASTIESTRLLLNSATREHPTGLGNSSGALGHYLMDHSYGVGVGGLIPAVKNYPYNFDDGRANGIYIPKFRNIGERHPKFIRGYGIQGGAQRGMLPPNLKSIPGFGQEFKKIVRDDKSAAPFGMGAWGEMLPRFDNQVTINKDKKDAWGIPTVHIDCTHGDNERAMVKDAVECLQEMAQEAGFEVTRVNSNAAAPGLCIHEVGTARMGDDPKKSVLNKFNQSWDVKNLFVTDGACFASQGCQNPTLTMMAITVRACDYIVEEHKKGNL